MAKTIFVMEGGTVDYTPSSDVASGDVVVQTDLVGVARMPIAANTLGSLAICGIFDFPKATGTSTGIAVGTKVYWDTTNKVVTATVGSNKYLGKTTKVAADADATVRVQLTP